MCLFNKRTPPPPIPINMMYVHYSSSLKFALERVQLIFTLWIFNRGYIHLCIRCTKGTGEKWPEKENRIGVCRKFLSDRMETESLVGNYLAMPEVKELKTKTTEIASNKAYVLARRWGGGWGKGRDARGNKRYRTLHSRLFVTNTRSKSKDASRSWHTMCACSCVRHNDLRALGTCLSGRVCVCVWCT